MINKKLNDVMSKWSDLITYLEVIADYCKYNRNINQVSMILPLFLYICQENRKLYEQLDYLEMETFDFKQNNLK